MQLDRLAEKAKEYELSEELIEERENERLSFIEKFPKTDIKALSIDQYVQGTDENSFCYWLEFKKIGFGIGGGNASKFGIYKAKDGKYYASYGKNKRELSGSELEDFYKDILSGILKALEYADTDRIDKIKEIDIPVWNMVLQKILSLYYPEKFLTIGSASTLIKCAKKLGIDHILLKSENLIEINYECKKLLNSIPPFEQWSYEKTGSFIWDLMHGEVEKKKVKSTKQYWLYSAGEGANMWDDFYKEGIMGLGWDQIGDLSQYGTRNEIKKALVQAYGGSGSKSNDVSANDDFLNKLRLGDIIIVKKGRHELLGYGILVGDYEYDESRSTYQKIRKVDWKIRGSWEVGFSLVVKTLTDITSYKADDGEHEFYYEQLMGIMGESNSHKNNRDQYISWLTRKHGGGSGTVGSYPKAIDILSEILSKDIYHIVDDQYLETLYRELIEEQSKPKGKYYYEQAPSYGINKFYSASIKSYREFLKVKHKQGGQVEAKKKFPLNTILYGPPGTGKTYNSIDRAVQIAAPEEYKSDNHKANKKVYDRLVESKQIQLTTFHQSMTYEDFVEGIKPVSTEEEDGNIQYEVVPGIFKKLCIEAAFSFIEPGLGTKANSVLGFSAQYDLFVEEIEEVLSKEDTFELKTRSGGKVKVHSISSQGNIIIKHLGGEVKYTVSKARLSRLNEAFPKMEDIKNIHNDFVSIIGGTNSTTYWAVLNAIREKNYSSDERKVSYSFEEKQEAVSTMTSDQFSKDDPGQFVLIIDEINRGNIAAIMGELITLIETDKRLGCPESQKALLPYSKEKFGVPPNLSIIGTMNTADRSVEALDTALRRRFSFIEMPPHYDLPELDKEVAGVNLAELLKVINGRIEKLLDKDHLIGHSYFIGVDGVVDLSVIFNDKVVPLLQEYFYNDFAKIGMVLGKGFVERKEDPIRFADFEDGLNGDYENREIFAVRPIPAEELPQALSSLMNGYGGN